jgi:hypothetical protein
MLYAKPWEHLSAVATLSIVILLSPRINSSTRYTCCFCRNLNRATWSGIICDFLTSFREFLDPAVNRFTRQTLPTVNRQYLCMNILCIESFCHITRMTEHSSVVQSSTVAILTTETSTWTCACASSTYTVMKLDREYYKSFDSILLR